MTLAIHEPQGEPGADIAVRQPHTTIARLTDWAQEARAAASIAQSLVTTSFVPDAFRGKPAEATAAILTGFEMGLSPMASLRAIYVIKGTPAMYAHTMRAIAQARGHRITVVEQTNTRAIVEGQRKGSSDVERVTWTMDRAKAAGLLANQQYTKNPQNMLVARATAEICKRIAADALHGISASVEELDGDVDTPAGNGTAAEPARRTVKRKPLERLEAAEPALPPQPAATGEPGDEAPVSAPPAAAEPITAPQQRKMHALFREVGLADRLDALAAVSKVLGRDVDSTKNLTVAEAGVVIDALEERKAQQTVVGEVEWPETAQPGGDN